MEAGKERETGCGVGEMGKGGEEVDRMALQRAPRGTPASSHCVSHVDWKTEEHKCGEGCFYFMDKIENYS